MRRHLTIALAGLASIAGFTAIIVAPTGAAIAAPASEQTKTFAIKNMTCPTCPITVKTAMSRVTGVKLVKIDFAAKTATVTYDAAIATPAKIAAASTDVGYPAQLQGG
ncbi:MAG: heavy-metal-associated domain-containing protein [Sphingomonas sp.]|jgi:mercuric ion binding protein|uniref:heavy-metal-associated domain-containing protein n=1 Tax=Sphingomonas sp. TaxID=28214 RepID=UPI003563D881